MRTFKTDAQRKACFANMTNGKYIPISRFAEEPVKKPDIVVEQPILKTESIIPKTEDIPPIEYKFGDELKSNENIPEESFTGSFTGRIPVSVESGEKVITPEEDIKQTKVIESTALIPVSNVRDESSEKENINDESHLKPSTIIDVEYKVKEPGLKDKLYGEARTLSDKAKAGFEAGVTKGFTSVGEDVVRGVEGAGVRIVRAPIDIAKGVVMLPYKTIKYGGEQIGRGISLTGKAAKRVAAGGLMVLAPAAAAFGTTAGVGVTEALRETGDLISAPKREFYMPPGYQRVWTGEGNNYTMQYIGSPQIQPTFMTPNLGISMPPGVTATREDIAESAAGFKNTPIFRGIEDQEKLGLINIGTKTAGEAFERMQSRSDNISPNIRVVKMPYKQAADEFIKNRGTNQQYKKSQKQLEVEAIMNIPIFDAAKAFEKKAKIVVSQKSSPAQTTFFVPKQSIQSSVSSPITVRVPVSSEVRTANISGAGGAANRYISSKVAYDKAKASGDIGSADRLQSRMQQNEQSLKRSSTAESAAIQSAIGG